MTAIHVSLCLALQQEELSEAAIEVYYQSSEWADCFIQK